MGAFRIFSKFAQLLDRTTVDLPSINGPLGTALGGKADGSALSSHTGNTSNPHSVTAAQVGAVSYSVVQSLTDLQKTKARTNTDSANTGADGDTFTGPITFSANTEWNATATFTLHATAKGLLQTALGISSLDTLSIAGINCSGTVTGTWQGTAIADAYIASAATWNAKAPGTVVTDYLDTNTITSGSTATWDGDVTLQPTLNQAHDLTLTIDNPGRTGSLSAIMASGGPYTLSLVAGSGYTIQIMDGSDVADVAALASGDGYELSYKLAGTVIRCWLTTYTL